MAQEAVSQFFDAVTRDQSLANELELAMRPEDYVRIGHEHGYEFTLDELQTTIEQQQGQFSDEQLVGGNVGHLCGDLCGTLKPPPPPPPGCDQCVA